MSPKTDADLFESIRTQAKLRMKLDLPVCMLMLLCIWQWGPSLPAISAVIPLFVLHILYSLGILHLTHSASRLPNARHIAISTAVMDPLLLSAGLALMGHTGQLFVCLYLFIILGYGFRVGPDAMLICQTAAVVGFVLVTLVNAGLAGTPGRRTFGAAFFAGDPAVCKVAYPIAHGLRPCGVRKPRKNPAARRHKP